MWEKLQRKFRNTRQQFVELGLAQALWFKFQRLRAKRRGAVRPYRLLSKHARHALWVRPHTSDILVFEQIFVEREYRCLDGVEHAGLIVDCGANVGYSSAYLLSRFPEARVIAVEPEEGNFGMLRRNLAPFGARAECLRAGVWSSSAPLRIEAPEFYGGKEWVYQVREARAGEAPEAHGVTLQSLWERAGSPEISVLKMDIEGAEAEVFEGGERGWLGSVRNFVVELHSARCHAALLAAIEGMDFVLSLCGELTVGQR